MAKRKSVVRRVVRYVRSKAKRAKGVMGSLGEPVKFAVAGVIYAGAGALSSMLPIVSGLPAIVKPGIVLLGLYLAGGMCRMAGYIGIGVETARYAMPLLSQLVGGLGLGGASAQRVTASI